jgi:spermidine synthase
MPKRPRGAVPAESARLSADAAARPLILLLFIGSGAAALIYEIVWFQLLPLVIGSSFVSLGTLVGAFMGGMCLGSLIAPRLLAGGRHPLRVYAALEIGIGAIGLALLWGLPLLGGVYAAIGGGHVVVRAAVAGVCLVPPAMLMGATLPVVARWVETSPAGVSWLGFFYGGNLAGAVAGCLAAGFYLLRVHDVAVATYVAVALNVTVAAAAWIIAGTRAVIREPAGVQESRPRAHGSIIVYLAIALSGFTALASEVIWTRQLSLVFGATVYAFSLILAVFLAGLGVGSSLGAALARTVPQPRVAFGWCQMMLAAAVVGAAHLISRSLPFWPIDPSLTSDALVVAELDVFRCALVVLPGAILWGASFPLALAAAATPGADGTRLVGRIYAANSLGAVAGAIAANLMVASVGSQVAQQVLVVCLAASALALLLPAIGSSPAGSRSRLRALALPIGAVVVAFLLVPTILPVPGTLVAYGRYSATWTGLTNIVYVGEGLSSSIAVSRASDGALTYHSAGKVQASSLPEDMRLQRMLGHLSHLLPVQANRALVIGFGAGVTAGALAISPAVDRLVIAEIEPLVPRFVAPYFADYNDRVASSPKVTFRLDDARHVLFTTDQTFDVITSDMVDPWVKGTAALFTREFFQAARDRLNPGGVVTLFVQLYQSNVEAVKSELATFMQVFPNTAVWGNTNNGEGYDLVVTGQIAPIRIDVDALKTRLASPSYGPVAQSLRDIGIGSAVELLSTYAGSAADLAPWLRNAVINRDRNLRLQYLAGLGLNSRAAGPIYAEMLQYATFPSHMLIGSPESIQAVREGIDRVRRR